MFHWNRHSFYFTELFGWNSILISSFSLIFVNLLPILCTLILIDLVLSESPVAPEVRYECASFEGTMMLWPATPNGEPKQDYNQANDYEEYDTERVSWSIVLPHITGINHRTDRNFKEYLVEEAHNEVCHPRLSFGRTPANAPDQIDKECE